ncbi:MAG: hypothetical protein GY847_28765 [Proteobacteria bacterium]|nr:hypothetical protein [Pseudomonadota bacterium]
MTITNKDNEIIYMADDAISMDCIRATRPEWAAFLCSTPWYSDYVEMCRDCNSVYMTQAEWVEDVLNDCLDEWDGDEIYKRMDRGY